MAANIAAFRTKVASRLKDAAAKLSVSVGGDVDTAIIGALEEYQKARPLEKAILIAGSGGFDYAIAGLTGWADGFSSVREIIYPWSSATPTPTIVYTDQYLVIRLSTGLFLRFLTARPGATEQFHVLYSIPHAVDAGQSTVVASDDEALSDLAACYACEALAGFYSQSTDGSLNADTVDHRSKADMYRSQAKNWRAAYKAKMLADEADGPASAAGQVVSTIGGGAFRPHFHDRKWV